MSDELVKELTIAISRADDFGVKILTAAIALIRAEVLEQAAVVIENDCHDDMTRAEEAAAIRAMKEERT
jgi:hypothetical protein